MIKKLKWKFVAVNMILVSSVLLIVFSILLYTNYARAQKESEEVMRNTLMRDFSMEPPKFAIGSKEHHNSISEIQLLPVFSVRVDDDWNVLSVWSDNVAITDEVLDDALTRVSQEEEEIGTLSELNLRYLIQPSVVGYRIAFVDISAEAEAFRTLIITCLLVALIGLAAFFFISLFLAELSLKPVRLAWERQRQFVADASHELKTPITVANTGILSAHKEDTIGEQQKWVNYISAEAERMKGLVEDLLFLAKSDAAESPILKTSINFSDLVWSCLLPFESVAFEQGVTLNSEIAPDLFFTGNEGQLKQLVIILLDNACKYAGRKGSVTLILERSQDKIRLSVNNTGEVIPSEHLQSVFERFYRVDKARARSEGGYGLGLAIAEQIVSNHKGRITADSSVKLGTTFTVYL